MRWSGGCEVLKPVGLTGIGGPVRVGVRKGWRTGQRVGAGAVLGRGGLRLRRPAPGMSLRVCPPRTEGGGRTHVPAPLGARRVSNRAPLPLRPRYSEPPRFYQIGRAHV